MKPYAYAVFQGNDNMENVSLQFDHPEMCGQTYRQAIPLYTHPVKQLSDGEIEQISHRYHYTYNPDYVGFAKAIIKEITE